MRKLVRGAMLSAIVVCASSTALPVLSQSAPQPEARVIVKFRTDRGAAHAASAQDRVQSLSQRTGLTLLAHSHVSPDMQVLRANGISSAELARRIAQQPNVEYAVEDKRLHINALPNDPLYAQQWYLHADEIAGINAQAAWDVSTGSSSVVVAVIDTGVRFDHEDLSAKLLPGYDFISETTVSNDGNGRDADASDPGDAQGTEPSSWHGTRVAGIIGAQTNNSVGMAGVAWQTRILPVRVIGVGGGFFSDIAAGMRWAAGLTVPGVPDNPTPAKVLNLSLGGDGTCDPVFQQAVAEIIAHGAVIVVSAGNDTGPVSQPANCAGVLAVAGVRHVGTKVGYSSFGAEVGISAPAGNCVNLLSGQECLFPIDTTVNLGATVPAANGYTSRTIPNESVGTSFSAPLASGVLALMEAVNPALTSDKAIQRIKLAARPFPAPDATLPTCPATGALGSTQEGQCNCTTTTCGAGLLDASGALTQAARPVANVILPGALTAGTTLQLDGSGSTAIAGATVVTYGWTVTGGVVTSLVNTDAAVATVVVPTAGTYTVTLSVTDSNGKTDQTAVSMTVGNPATVSSTSAGDSSGGGGGGALSLVSMLGILALAALTRHLTQN